MAKTKKKEKKPVEVIVFEDPLKKRQQDSKEAAERRAKFNANKDDKQPVFNQKRAKYEIRKLAIDGMDKTQKEMAMTDFLIELGAKKPKGKHVSLQEYQKEKKEKKLAGQEEVLEDSGAAKKAKSKRKRDKDDILDFVDGQVGTYRKGVQFLKGGKKRRKRF